MTAPLITGTASGSIALPCSIASANQAWGTVGAPTFIAVINPGDVTAYVALGGTGVVVNNAPAGGTPVPPGQTVYLATAGSTNIAGATLRNGTQLTIIPST